MGEIDVCGHLAAGLTQQERMKMNSTPEFGALFEEYAKVLYTTSEKIRRKDPEGFKSIYDNLFNITLEEFRIRISD
jgi:hypothetical protein